MPALVAGIHDFSSSSKTWMARTSPAMTVVWTVASRDLKPKQLGHLHVFQIVQPGQQFGALLVSKHGR